MDPIAVDVPKLPSYTKPAAPVKPEPAKPPFPPAAPAAAPGASSLTGKIAEALGLRKNGKILAAAGVSLLVGYAAVKYLAPKPQPETSQPLVAEGKKEQEQPKPAAPPAPSISENRVPEVGIPPSAGFVTSPSSPVAPVAPVSVPTIPSTPASPYIPATLPTAPAIPPTPPEIILPATSKAGHTPTIPTIVPPVVPASGIELPAVPTSPPNVPVVPPTAPSVPLVLPTTPSVPVVPPATPIVPPNIAPPSLAPPSIAPPSLAPPSTVFPPAALPTTPSFGGPGQYNRPYGAPESTASTTFDVDLYEPTKVDTYGTISKEFYNDAKYAAALAEYNGRRALQGGVRVEVPPIHVLKKRFPQMVGAVVPASASAPVKDPWGPSTEGSPAFRPTGSRTFTVPTGGLRMGEIAREVLGSPTKWSEIWDLNPQLSTSDLLPAGTVVKIPTNVK